MVCVFCSLAIRWFHRRSYNDKQLSGITFHGLCARGKKEATTQTTTSMKKNWRNDLLVSRKDNATKMNVHIEYNVLPFILYNPFNERHIVILIHRKKIKKNETTHRKKASSVRNVKKTAFETNTLTTYTRRMKRMKISRTEIKVCIQREWRANETSKTMTKRKNGWRNRKWLNNNKAHENASPTWISVYIYLYVYVWLPVH